MCLESVFFFSLIVCPEVFSLTSGLSFNLSLISSPIHIFILGRCFVMKLGHNGYGGVLFMLPALCLEGACPTLSERVCSTFCIIEEKIEVCYKYSKKSTFYGSKPLTHASESVS